MEMVGSSGWVTSSNCLEKAICMCVSTWFRPTLLFRFGGVAGSMSPPSFSWPPKITYLMQWKRYAVGRWMELRHSSCFPLRTTENRGQFFGGKWGAICSGNVIVIWLPFAKQPSPGRIIYIQGIGRGAWGRRGAWDICVKGAVEWRMFHFRSFAQHLKRVSPEATRIHLHVFRPETGLMMDRYAQMMNVYWWDEWKPWSSHKYRCYANFVSWTCKFCSIFHYHKTCQYVQIHCASG